MAMDKHKDNSLTQQRLKELLHYDPETGKFTRLVARRGIAKEGAVAGSLHSKGYIRITIGDNEYLAHRLAFLYMTGNWPEFQVDHKDLDKVNNAWDNIRESTSTQNNANKAGRGQTGFKGVTKSRGNFRAMISINGKQCHLGTRSTPEEAHALYAKAANDVFGEFSRTA
ncbi:hypothetical protein KNLIENLN_00037 [Sinorhizobium phage NV1.1.1]|nr:hypothetical protein KNLIENLN_00037 [Sinorhizobium phage NV1.1.1]